MITSINNPYVYRSKTYPPTHVASPTVFVFLCLIILLCPMAANSWTIRHPGVGMLPLSISTRSNKQGTTTRPRRDTKRYYKEVDEKEDVTPSFSISPSPLSLKLDDLGKAIGGKGRAQASWDCFRIGVDPLWFFDESSSQTEPCIDLLSLSDEDGDDANIQSPLQIYTTTAATKETIEHRFETKRRKSNGLGRKAIDTIKEKFASSNIESTVANLVEVSTSADGTTKLLLRLFDGFEVETVIIPWDDRQRSTLCVSSQVGCRQGCTFCATGKMGKLRSLSSDEILAQVYWAQKACRVRGVYSIDNIVFMGMGEPADNADSVVKAAEILVDKQLFQLAPRRVTISTVAPTPQAFWDLGSAPVVLAWSVHASRDHVRKKLVPTTRYSMAELRDEGLIPVLNQRSKRMRATMLEFALIEGINDNPEDALDLVEFCQPLLQNVPGIKLVVNLIPWNDIRTPSSPFEGDVALREFRRPSDDRVLSFQKILTEGGILCYIRTTRGDDENSACGQLATKKKK